MINGLLKVHLLPNVDQNTLQVEEQTGSTYRMSLLNLHGFDTILLVVKSINLDLFAEAKQNNLKACMPFKV